MPAPRAIKDFNEIAAFVKERDAVLASGDVHACTLFLLKHNPGMKPPSNMYVAEAMMHKARTGATTLPIELRRQSKKWLTEHGMKSFDDGDL